MSTLKRNAVVNVAFRHNADHAVGEPISGTKLEDLVSVCISRAITALDADTQSYTRDQRFQISDVFKSMLSAHRTIRRLLKDVTSADPESVDALSLLRLQFEGLFVICLMLEDQKYVQAYVQDYWRKQYVQYLLVREECGQLSNYHDYLTNAPPNLHAMRHLFGITEEQQATVDLEELGTPLPLGMQRQDLLRFPTPGGVPSKIANPDKQRVLERLLFEYVYLCSFAHVQKESNLLRGLFDKRSRHRDDARLTDEEVNEKYEMLIVSAANLKSCLCIAHAVTELTLLYPNNLELREIVTRTWNTISEANLLARIVWALRAKGVLGIVG
jgi:hypothetical protein